MEPSSDPHVGRCIATNYIIREALGYDERGLHYLTVHRRTGAFHHLWLVSQDAYAGDPDPDHFSPPGHELWWCDLAVHELQEPALLGVRYLGEHGGFKAFLRPHHERCLRDLTLPLAIDRAADLARQLADALASLHGARIAHGAIHPICLELDAGAPPGAQLRLVDFIRAYRGDQRSWKHPSAMAAMAGIARYAYLPAESLTGRVTHPERVDIYAAGAVLGTLLTGLPPLDHESAPELMMRVMNGQTRRHPAELRPEVPLWIDAIVAQAMDPDPERRFPSATHLARALRAHGA